jgi:hypothetical protein
MGVFGSQARNIVTSAVVSATLPDQVNEAKEVVSGMLPENMKAAIGLTAIAASLAYGAVKENSQEKT